MPVISKRDARTQAAALHQDRAGNVQGILEQNDVGIADDVGICEVDIDREAVVLDAVAEQQRFLPIDQEA